MKTVGFADPKYVGDPINVVKIFNEKVADELSIFDIDASVKCKEPDYSLISNLAAASRMPLTYGGGVKTTEQARKIISLGIEKVAISSAAVQTPSLVSSICDAVGSQSVVVVLDVKRRPGSAQYDVWIHNGKVNTGRTLFDTASQMEKLGAGELVVNSIEQDGRMAGYDLRMLEHLANIGIPITALGGAGSLNDIAKLIETFGLIGAGAGSLFVFKGIYRAVLVSYPTVDQRTELLQRSFAPLIRGH